MTLGETITGRAPRLFADLRRAPPVQTIEFILDKRLDQKVAWLYRVLDTLDSKASSLLAFNALVLAAQSVLVAAIIDVPSQGLKAAALLLLLVPLVTSIYAVFIFQVEWLFLARIHEEGEKNELVCLSKICDDRVRDHRRLWRASFYAVPFAFLLTLFVALLRLG